MRLTYKPSSQFFQQGDVETDLGKPGGEEEGLD
jgi:hypothetical protein